MNWWLLAFQRTGCDSLITRYKRSSIQVCLPLSAITKIHLSIWQFLTQSYKACADLRFWLHLPYANSLSVIPNVKVRLFLELSGANICRKTMQRDFKYIFDCVCWCGKPWKNCRLFASLLTFLWRAQITHTIGLMWQGPKATDFHNNCLVKRNKTLIRVICVTVFLVGILSIIEKPDAMLPCGL